MTAKEAYKLHARIGFQYETILYAIVARHLIDPEMVYQVQELFYDQLGEEKLKIFDRVMESDAVVIRCYIWDKTCGDMVLLTELARQYLVSTPEMLSKAGCANAIHWSLFVFGKMR